MREDHIQWRTYKGVAGVLQSLLIGNLYGQEYHELYNDFSWFNLSYKRTKRKITKNY